MVNKFLDANGISYLWNQLSLQDYPNNETLVAIINAIDENKADANYETWTFTLSDGTTLTKKVNLSGN